MMGAIGRRETELASAIGQLPDFMRQFNTTAVNLRAALDDVDPLVTASRPVARKLQPFARSLRGFARDSVPTIKGLDGIVKRKGAANDLIELTDLQVPLAEIGVGPVTRNGASRAGRPARIRPGARPTACRPALRSSAPTSPRRVVGWFDDFGHSGFPDANGGIGRIGTTFNAFSLSGAGRLPDRPRSACRPARPPAEAIEALLDINNLRALPRLQRARPTATARRRFTDGGAIDCDPSQVPIGPMRRIALILGAARRRRPALVVAAAGADDKRTYQAELFNAFGLVEGSELRVAGRQGRDRHRPRHHRRRRRR